MASFCSSVKFPVFPHFHFQINSHTNYFSCYIVLEFLLYLMLIDHYVDWCMHISWITQNYILQQNGYESRGGLAHRAIARWAPSFDL